jgi:hypothetical protein
MDRSDTFLAVIFFIRMRHPTYLRCRCPALALFLVLAGFRKLGTLYDRTFNVCGYFTSLNAARIRTVRWGGVHWPSSNMQ